jgi:hypothetical protein
VKGGLLDVFVASRDLFRTPRPTVGGRSTPEADERERHVYGAFSRLSLLIRSFRAAGLATGEVSR